MSWRQQAANVVEMQNFANHSSNDESVTTATIVAEAHQQRTTGCTHTPPAAFHHFAWHFGYFALSHSSGAPSLSCRLVEVQKLSVRADGWVWMRWDSLSGSLRCFPVVKVQRPTSTGLKRRLSTWCIRFVLTQKAHAYHFMYVHIFGDLL